jgi:hypothetical protein
MLTSHFTVVQGVSEPVKCRRGLDDKVELGGEAMDLS